MEENCLGRPQRSRSRTIALLIFFVSLLPVRAQTTNLLNLCTEGALQAAVEIGGIYQFGNCGTSTVPTIKLTEPLVIQRDLSLVATQEVLLDGQDLTRLIVVKPGVHLTLRNILIFSGHHTETNFNDGGIPETAGAGIYNDGGFVTVVDGHFEANEVFGVTGLAGRAGSGEAGEAGGDAAGGAIYNNGGQITLSNVVFVGNKVTGGVGGAGGSGSSFGGNGGNGGDGGSGAGAAVYSRGGSVFIYASTFTTNNAVGSAAGAAGTAPGLLGFSGQPGEAGDGVGGAVSGDGAEITVYACTFFGNKVQAANGLAGNAGFRNHAGDSGRRGGDAAGGALFTTGHLWVTNSTFFANSAKSGNGGAGGAGGVTGFGGSGGDGGDGGNATGGAIENIAAATIVNCTFSDNVVTSGTGGAAGQQSGLGDAGKAGSVGFTSGGAVYGRSGEGILANSIFANSKISLGGFLTDRGGNLSTDRNSLLVNLTSLRLVNPLLSALASNGGPTQTMALGTNSPAFDRGVAEFCPSFDQRGTNRVGACDSGAYEIFTVATNEPLPEIPTNVLNGLVISGSTNLVTLSWPAGYTNLYLQFATNLLATNTAWALAPQTPATNSGSNVVTLNATNLSRPNAYFRLLGLTNLSTTNTQSTGATPPEP